MEFQVYCIVVKEFYNLQSDSNTHLAPYSYYNIIDYIPCAELYIPITVL